MIKLPQPPTLMIGNLLLNYTKNALVLTSSCSDANFEQWKNYILICHNVKTHSREEKYNHNDSAFRENVVNVT